MLAFGIVCFIIFGGAGAFLLIKGIRQGDSLDKYNTSGKGYIGISVFVFICAAGFLIFGIVTQNNLNSIGGGDDDYSYDYDDDDDDDYSYSGSGSFTNKYGTSTTKCAVAGCNNYIAKSGDTNCCTTHSNKCLECYCYIDGDAMYCMDCIKGALADDDDDDYGHECYICGDSAYSKYGSYYYCSDCLDLVKQFS